MMQIKVLVMDVDGTLTDGKIYMSDKGELFKAFNIKDGCGIHDMLPKVGIVPAVITARKSEIVKKRCMELGIMHCYQGYRGKEMALAELARHLNIRLDEDGIYQEIAYMGDDIIDISCMKRCGIIACPADAVKDVKEIADFISSKEGGNGAVREFIEWIISRSMKK